MKNQILVIGRHEEIMQTLLRLVNNMEGWEAKAALENNEARKIFDAAKFDIVLLSSGIEEDDEMSLCAYFRYKDPSIKIIQHYGGGSGLLKNELLQAMNEVEILQWLF